MTVISPNHTGKKQSHRCNFQSEWARGLLNRRCSTRGVINHGGPKGSRRQTCLFPREQTTFILTPGFSFLEATGHIVQTPVRSQLYSPHCASYCLNCSHTLPRRPSCPTLDRYSPCGSTRPEPHTPTRPPRAAGSIGFIDRATVNARGRARPGLPPQDMGQGRPLFCRAKSLRA
jgi:hypothetical protein